MAADTAWAVAGTERGFEAGSRFEPGCGVLQPSADEAGAVLDYDCKLAAVEAMLRADVAYLRLLFAARIAGLLLTKSGVALAVLIRERDAMLARLKHEQVTVSIDVRRKQLKGKYRPIAQSM